MIPHWLCTEAQRQIFSKWYLTIQDFPYLRTEKFWRRGRLSLNPVYDWHSQDYWWSLSLLQTIRSLIKYILYFSPHRTLHRSRGIVFFALPIDEANISFCWCIFSTFHILRNLWWRPLCLSRRLFAACFSSIFLQLSDIAKPPHRCRSVVRVPA